MTRRAEPTVRTVSGDVSPAVLGLCDAHDHLFLRSPRLPGQELADAGAAAAELRAFREAGGGTVVQWTPYGMGRHAGELPRLAEESGVRIVAATGLHQAVHYAPEVLERVMGNRGASGGVGSSGGGAARGAGLRDLAELRDLAGLFVAELTVGIGSWTGSCGEFGTGVTTGKGEVSDTGTTDGTGAAVEAAEVTGAVKTAGTGKAAEAVKAAGAIKAPETVEAVRAAGGAAGCPRAGMIKVAGGFHGLDAHARYTMAAAAEAHHATGAPIGVHLELGTGAPDVLDLLCGTLEVPPQRVILGHLNRSPDPVTHRSAAAAGAYLAFDGPSRAHHATDWRLPEALAALADAGYGDRLLLGGDTTTAAARSVDGGPGMPHLLRHLRPRLEVTLGETLVRDIFTANPARAFAVAWEPEPVPVPVPGV
ncbi:phosphotriesterase [Streptomyces sp. NPDC018045]|uniref:phosphotriesterase family protein n=1 Tax=Streptomyces sp. NPDC018045 TaxID=3365037 RepID=UPI003797949B